MSPFLRAARLTLKIAFLYPIDGDNPFLLRALHGLWGFVIFSTFTITCLQSWMGLAMDGFDLGENSVVFMNIFLYSSFYATFGVFWKYWRRLQKLFERTKEFEIQTDNGVEEIGMEEAARISDRIVYGSTIAYTTSAFLFGALVIFSSERELVVPGWLPYDYKKSPFYELTVLWHLLCQINLGLFFTPTDNIYPAITIVVSQQFRILASNFRNNFHYSLLKTGIHKNLLTDLNQKLEDGTFFEKILETVRKSAFKTINNKYLEKNIKHHQMLLDFCQDLNDCFGKLLIVKIVSASTYLVFILFTLITSGGETIAIGLVSYLTFGFTEVLLYTYGGQILTENADFSKDLYECPWYLCDLEFRKKFLMVQVRVSRRVSTKAGNYFEMIAPTFVQFARTVFSYAAVLRQLTNTK